MTAKQFTVFDVETRIAAACITCTDEALPEQVKDGQIAIEGRWRSARLNELNEPTNDPARRDSATRDQRRGARLARVEELESKSLRRMRELLIQLTDDPQLKALDQEIANDRQNLRD